MKKSTHLTLRPGWQWAALAVGAIFVMVMLTTFIPRMIPQVYTTRPASGGVVAMPDGSHVRLGGDSAIKVQYSQDERHVQLMRGEAWFHVLHDAHRPFVVHTNQTKLVSTSSQFHVDRISDKALDIEVAQGSLEWQNQVESAVLHSGQALHTAPGTLVRSLITPQEYAWQNPWYRAQNAPLSEVLDKLSRHSKIPIRIAKRSLREPRISTQINTANPDQALQSLRKAYGLSIVKTTREIRISYPSR